MRSFKILTGLLILLLATHACELNTKNKFEKLGLEEITIDELQTAYKTGAFTVREVVEAYLERIDAIDKNGPSLNAILQINPDALALADVLDHDIKEGNWRGPLHGIPVILKDNIDTGDKMQTTVGSRILAQSNPPDDSFIVKKLRENGALILGKGNLSEWANFHSSFSSSGWSGLGGQTRNPYDITRNPCGSSSGPAVAVSANLTTVGIGTETNGSIVCPSNANGIVGIKPTVGLWSRDGIVPISYTNDSAGPLTRTVKDAAIMLSALAGVDANDKKTAASKGKNYSDYTQFLNSDGLAGKKIGLYTAPLGTHYKVDTLVYQTVRFLEKNGVKIIKIDRISEQNIGGDEFQVLLYEFKDGLNAYFKSLGPDAPVKSIDELAEKIRNNPKETETFDRDLIFRAVEKGSLDSKEYKDALTRMVMYSRQKGIDRVMDAFGLDAIISPTGSPAWKTDQVMGDNYTLSSSSPSARAGYPVINVPMGDIDGLPVGLSFFGRAWSEPKLLEIAYAFEQKTKARIVPTFKGE